MEAEATLDAAQRAHLRVCGLVTLETIVCFFTPVVTLAMGTVYSPVLVGAAFGPLAYWRPLTEFVLGWAGVLGVGRLLYLLWHRPTSDPRPWLTLLSVGCGCAASFLAATDQGPRGVIMRMALVYMPMACALHLVVLNRRSLLN